MIWRPGNPAGRLRNEIKLLQAVDLAVGGDPLARQAAVEAAGGACEGAPKYGRVANAQTHCA